MGDAFVLRARMRRPTASDLKRLRELVPLGFGELRRRAAAGEALDAIEPFVGDWSRDRSRMVSWHAALTAQSPVVRIFRAEPGDRPDAELSAVNFHAALAALRCIEIDQQRASDLECGYIRTPDEFVPHEDDWVPSS